MLNPGIFLMGVWVSMIVAAAVYVAIKDPFSERHGRREPVTRADSSAAGRREPADRPRRAINS